ncbi:hypothetical protein [Cohnella sp. WQ 127256]|uniref:hypothetical protein n=1 Tax=Cohnella sp. WQ 127256 TaxID=2938790 RepID=UPI0021174E44|nr:hypothetical protein [Cohnella sp. WQ 127256]
MRYSIRGSIRTRDGSSIVSDINRFVLWRLVTINAVDQSEYPIFTFEAWVNSIADKDALFNVLKLHVDTLTGEIDWHECNHDELISKPCVIIETYKGR